MQSYRSLFTTFLLLCIIILLQTSCQEESFTPKPRGYPRIELPAKDYALYEPTNCPFTFEKPNYVGMQKDTVFFRQLPENPCWMNLDFKDLGAKVHMSYKTIEKDGDLVRYLKDAYKLNSKHVKKADYIEDSVFITPNGAYGIYYTVGGDAASSTQFVITDSTRHFIWASLYFNAAPNADSIAPVNRFVRADIEHLINTFKWK